MFVYIISFISWLFNHVFSIVSIMSFSKHVFSIIAFQAYLINIFLFMISFEIVQSSCSDCLFPLVSFQWFIFNMFSNYSFWTITFQSSLSNHLLSLILLNHLFPLSVLIIIILFLIIAFEPLLFHHLVRIVSFQSSLFNNVVLIISFQPFLLNHCFSNISFQSFESFLIIIFFPIISFEPLLFTTSLHPTTLECLPKRWHTSGQVLPLSESISRMLFKRCGSFLGGRMTWLKQYGCFRK